MGQVKIFGLKEVLNTSKIKMSEVIHSCLVDGLKFPADKKFQRFFPMELDDFYFPAGRTEKYTIVEVSLFEGRTVETKKDFIRMMFERFKEQLAIEPDDLEITLTETPKHNWGIRGLPGDELTLNYKVNI